MDHESTIQDRKRRNRHLLSIGLDKKFIQFSCSVVSDSLQPHESQHTRPPCPSPSPGVHSNSHPLSGEKDLMGKPE